MAAKRAMLLVATTSFVTEIGGEAVHVHEGEVVPDNHPAVKGREDLFQTPDHPDHEAA